METGRFINYLLYIVHTPSVSGNNSNVIITSYAYESLAVHPGSNNHVRMCNLVYGHMLSLSSKKERNGKVSLKNGIVGIDNKMTINTLMKHLYIAVQYFYITS